MTRFWTFYWVECWRKYCPDWSRELLWWQRAGQVCPQCAGEYLRCYSPLSLSVLTVTRSVRPSPSQLARFGLVTEFRKKRNKSFQLNIPSHHPVCYVACISLFCAVLLYFFYLCNFIKYFSSFNFPVSELLRSRQGRGEERRGRGTVWPLNLFDKRSALPFIIY